MTLRELTMAPEASARAGGVGPALTEQARNDLVRLFGLDRLPTHRPPLLCHWQRGADGRLFCVWRRDTKPAFAP